MMRFIMADLPLTMDMIRQAVKGDKVYKEMNEAIRNEIKSKEDSDSRRQDARLQTTLREWVVDLGHSAHQGMMPPSGFSCHPKAVQGTGAEDNISTFSEVFP